MGQSEVYEYLLNRAPPEGASAREIAEAYGIRKANINRALKVMYDNKELDMSYRSASEKGGRAVQVYKLKVEK